MSIDSSVDPEPPKTPLQALTAGIPRWFLIAGIIVWVGALVVLVLVLVALIMLVGG